MERAIQHVDEHVFLDLVQGLIAETETERVRRHLEECPPCEAEFGRWVSNWETARARGTSRPYATATTRGRVARRHILIPAAAVAVAAALAAVFLPRAFVDTSRIRTLPPTDNLLRHRDTTSDVSAELLGGLAAYAAGDLDRSIRELRSAKALGSWEASRRAHLGSALALTQRYARAVAVLEELDFDLLPDPWRGECLWTYYVSLVELGHDARARTVLEGLSAEPGEIGQRAREELGQL